MKANIIGIGIVTMMLSASTAAASMIEVFLQVGDSVGQGFLVPRGSECFVITARHLFENEGPESITVIGQQGAQSSGILVKEYPDDLAIIRVETNGKFCSGASWPDIQNLENHLQRAIGKRGTIRSRSEDGGIRQLEVEITYMGDRNLTVITSHQKFRRGHSGSLLYLEDRPVGILLTVPAEESTEGRIFRLDRALEILSSYLRPSTTLDSETKKALFTAVSNAEAVEIEALSSLDTSRLSSVYTGTALKDATEEVKQARGQDITVVAMPSGMEIQDVSLDPDGVHAQVKIYVKSSGMLFLSKETGECAERLPPYEGLATTFLERKGENWLVSDIQRHFSVPMPEACGELTAGEEEVDESEVEAQSRPAPSALRLDVQQTSFAPHAGGLNGGPGLTFRLSGIIQVPGPGTLQVRVLFMFPDGRVLVPHPQEVTYRDPQNRLATGSPQYQVTTGALDLSTLPIYPIPTYSLNLVATGYMTNYQIVAAAQVYLNQTFIAESTPTEFILSW